MIPPTLARLAAPGAALLLALAPIPFLGDLRPRAPQLLALWLAAHAVYLLASVRVLRAPAGAAPAPAAPPAPAAAPRAPAPHALAIVLGIGLLARALLLVSPPTLSEDVYRYLWDGRLVAAGVNPYPHAPADPALARFRDALPGRLNHPDVPTIYPPAAQLLFAAAAAVAPHPLAWKLLLLAAEGLLLLALAALLRSRGLPPERLLLYYWNPLVIVESFGSGHVDLVVAAFLLGALALEEARRSAPAGAAYALAVLTKYVPVLLVPYWLRRRRGALLLAAAGVSAALLLPFAGAGSSLWTGLAIYSRHWEWNGLAYPLLRAAGLGGDTARAALAAGLACTALAVAWRARSASGAALAGLTAFTLLSPTVFPWYLVPVAALLPLHPDAGLLVFTGLVPLSYAGLPRYAATGEWGLPSWVPWVEYGALLLAWAGVATRRARAQRRAAAWSTESPPT